MIRKSLPYYFFLCCAGYCHCFGQNIVLNYDITLNLVVTANNIKSSDSENNRTAWKPVHEAMKDELFEIEDIAVREFDNTELLLYIDSANTLSLRNICGLYPLDDKQALFIEVCESATRKMKTLTKNNMHKYLVLVFNGEVIAVSLIDSVYSRQFIFYGVKTISIWNELVYGKTFDPNISPTPSIQSHSHSIEIGHYIIIGAFFVGLIVLIIVLKLSKVFQH